MLHRRFLDDDFLEWEVYATTGEYGTPNRPVVVFHCLSDRQRRARTVRQEGDRTQAERLVEQASDAELKRLLQEEAQEVY